MAGASTGYANCETALTFLCVLRVLCDTPRGRPQIPRYYNVRMATKPIRLTEQVKAAG